MFKMPCPHQGSHITEVLKDGFSEVQAQAHVLRTRIQASRGHCLRVVIVMRVLWLQCNGNDIPLRFATVTQSRLKENTKVEQEKSISGDEDEASSQGIPLSDGKANYWRAALYVSLVHLGQRSLHDNLLPGSISYEGSVMEGVPDRLVQPQVFNTDVGRKCHNEQDTCEVSLYLLR